MRNLHASMIYSEALKYLWFEGWKSICQSFPTSNLISVSPIRYGRTFVKFAPALNTAKVALFRAPFLRFAIDTTLQNECIPTILREIMSSKNRKAYKCNTLLYDIGVLDISGKLTVGQNARSNERIFSPS